MTAETVLATRLSQLIAEAYRRKVCFVPRREEASGNYDLTQASMRREKDIQHPLSEFRTILESQFTAWNVPTELVAEIENGMTSVTYQKGATIFSRGAPAHFIFWLRKGLVKLYLSHANGNRTREHRRVLSRTLDSCRSPGRGVRGCRVRSPATRFESADSKAFGQSRAVKWGDRLIRDPLDHAMGALKRKLPSGVVGHESANMGAARGRVYEVRGRAYPRRRSKPGMRSLAHVCRFD